MTTKSTHDFEDGLGPVSAHQHPNGGGWVADSATVADTAYVGPSAHVGGLAIVTDSAIVAGKASVGGSAIVWGSACVGGSAIVDGSASVGGSAVVWGSAIVDGSASVGGSAIVDGSASVGKTIENYPLEGVPFVEGLDAKMLASVDCLDMSQWHCNTTHCRAGWAITYAGEAGAELERQVGPWLAGALIYVRSTGRIELPDFFASDSDAKADIERCARL